jgi:hypothetical protein
VDFGKVDEWTAEIGMKTTANSPTDCELRMIDYMSRRIERWVEDSRQTLERDQNHPDWNSQRWFGQEAVVKGWTTMTDLTVEFDAERKAPNRGS